MLGSQVQSQFFYNILDLIYFDSISLSDVILGLK